MGFISDIFGGGDQADAARDASDAQLQATRESNDLLREIWGQSRTDLEPWRQAGITGLNRLMQLTGLPTVDANPVEALTYDQLREQLAPQFTTTTTTPGGGIDWNSLRNHPDYWVYAQHGTVTGSFGNAMRQAQQAAATTVDEAGLSAAIQDRLNQQQQAQQQRQEQANQPVDVSAVLSQDPGYQFRLQQGQQALERQQAARGTLLSGRAMKDAANYNQGMASQEYGNAWNRLANIAGIGQNATSESNQLGSSYGQQMASNLIQGGNARASGYLAQGQASQGGFNNLLGAAGTGAALWTAFSDRRLKTNIRRAGTHASGLPWYEFEYVWGEPGQGVMADEAMIVRPGAVGLHESGYLTVNYGAL